MFVVALCVSCIYPGLSPIQCLIATYSNYTMRSEFLCDSVVRIIYTDSVEDVPEKYIIWHVDLPHFVGCEIVEFDCLHRIQSY